MRACLVQPLRAAPIPQQRLDDHSLVASDRIKTIQVLVFQGRSTLVSLEKTSSQVNRCGHFPLEPSSAVSSLWLRCLIRVLPLQTSLQLSSHHGSTLRSRRSDHAGGASTQPQDDLASTSYLSTVYSTGFALLTCARPTYDALGAYSLVTEATLAITASVPHIPIRQEAHRLRTIRIYSKHFKKERLRVRRSRKLPAI